MGSLIKTINTYSGNLCFVGNSEGTNYLFECNRITGALTYCQSYFRISDIVSFTSGAYLIAFSTNQIGLFQNGNLTYDFIITEVEHVDKFVFTGEDVIYVLDRTNNELHKLKRDET